MKKVKEVVAVYSCCWFT